MTDLEPTVAHWFRDAAWDDDSLEWDGFDERVRTAWVDVGAPDDPHRPLVMFVRYSPGITVRPHAHASDYVSMVLEGEVTVTGRRHGVGSVRTVAAGTTYGPLVAGPEGTLLVDIFSDRNGLFPQWAKVDEDARERLAALERYNRERLAALRPRPRTTRDGRRASG